MLCPQLYEMTPFHSELFSFAVYPNYKIAVPQYYDGKIQLLLPLCLTSGSPNPDLALVVHSLCKTYC